MGTEFSLAPGQIAQIRDVPFQLGFVRVLSDSRCPADAICIRAGEASVRVRVTGTSAREFDVQTDDPARASVTHGDYRIVLVRLEPIPLASRPTAPGDYRATFQVTRLTVSPP